MEVADLAQRIASHTGHDARQRGDDKYDACCPNHDDQHASLSITKVSDRILIHCHVGCPPEEIVATVGLTMSDLYFDNGATERPHISKTYDYCDEDGTLLYQAVRYIPKGFSQRRPDPKQPGQWIWNMKGVRRVLYRLPELIVADSGKPVFVTEGEKDAEKLLSIGLVATCNVGGAGKWQEEYDQFFLGRPVIVVPHHDKAGYEHARKVFARLMGKAASIRVVRWPENKPDKFDAFDYFSEGGTVGQLILMATAETANLTVHDSAQTDDTKIEFERITSAELDNGNYELEYLIENVLVAKQPCIIAGQKKSLKTSIVIDLAISLSRAGHFLGKFPVTRSARVAVMTGESGLATIQETARRICHAAGCRLSDLDVIWSPDLPRLARCDHIEALEEFVRGDEIEVLVVDPAYLSLPGDDAGNIFKQGEMLHGITKACQSWGVMLVLAHHTRKAVSYDPPELESIAWSGFQEFARQWLLIGRREPYVPGTGEHRLWLSLGGSAGHGGLWGLDIDEGTNQSEDGRFWDVTIQTMTAVVDDQKRSTELQEANKQADTDAGRERKVANILRQLDGTWHSVRQIAQLCQMGNGIAGAALTAIVQSGRCERQYEDRYGGRYVYRKNQRT